MEKLCVIGSLNIDVVHEAPVLPRPGETVMGTSFHTFFGGKGGNQAMALGRLGAPVCMVGALGDGMEGPAYHAHLCQSGVDVSATAVLPGRMPGVACIGIDAAGENCITVVPGTNQDVTPAYLDAHWEALASCALFLFQQEIPQRTNAYALKRLCDMGKTILYDPAPAGAGEKDILAYPTYLTPNETELATLSGRPTDSEEQIIAACQALLDQGAQAIVAKVGKHGCYLCQKDRTLHVPGFVVDVVDTTAAGDSFNAGLAFALAEHQPIEQALRFANATGALATTGLGAQSAMPDKAQVLALIAACR